MTHDDPSSHIVMRRTSIQRRRRMFMLTIAAAVAATVLLIPSETSAAAAFTTAQFRSRKASALKASSSGGTVSSWGNRRGRGRGSGRAGNGSNSLVMMPSSVPMVPWQPPGQEYAQFVDIYTRLYRERIMVLGDFIDEEKANTIISTLLYLKQEDPNKKISLYVNCPGGLLRPSLAVYDTILSCRQDCEISTLNLALATGMGALICGAGTRGMRTSMPNARFLLQRVGMESPFQGQASDIALEVKNVKENNDRLEYELAKMTGQPVSKIREDMKRDFYLSSEEAVAYGLIDKVLLPPVKGISRVEYERDPWTGEKILVREPEVNLGVFGGPNEQRFEEKGTGWRGPRQPDGPPAQPPGSVPPGDDEPPTQK